MNRAHWYPLHRRRRLFALRLLCIGSIVIVKRTDAEIEADFMAKMKELRKVDHCG